MTKKTDSVEKTASLPESDERLLKTLANLAAAQGARIFTVGGYVRDLLLGRTTVEIDFVVLGDGPALARAARQRLNGKGFVVYPKFGTASFLIPDRKLEFVTARKETYSKQSRNPVVEKSSLAEDLARRDFTVNAMALSLEPDSFGAIIDPFRGQKDLGKQLIRTPLDPAQTFSDDPLRMMRAARFAGQLQFRIHEHTLSAMREQRERLKIVSQERITDELIKILSHDQPSIGLRILLEAGLMSIILPELADLVGVEQRDAYHHKDVFEHTLKVVDNVARVSDNLLLRFSALMHDIGKPRVKRFVKDQGWTFHGHELVGVRMLRHIIPRLKLSREYLRYTTKLTRLHMRPIQLIGEEITDSAIRRLIVQADQEMEDLMTLCRADITSGNPARVRKHLENFDHVHARMKEVEEKDRMRAFQSPVRGDEIMAVCGLRPGPSVGRLKKIIEEAILDGEIPNEHDAALDYLLRVKDRIINQ